MDAKQTSVTSFPWLRALRFRTCLSHSTTRISAPLLSESSPSSATSRSCGQPRPFTCDCYACYECYERFMKFLVRSFVVILNQLSLRTQNSIAMPTDRHRILSVAPGSVCLASCQPHSPVCPPPRVYSQQPSSIRTDRAGKHGTRFSRVAEIWQVL